MLILPALLSHGERVNDYAQWRRRCLWVGRGVGHEVVLGGYAGRTQSHHGCDILRGRTPAPACRLGTDVALRLLHRELGGLFGAELYIVNIAGNTPLIGTTEGEQDAAVPVRNGSGFISSTAFSPSSWELLVLWPSYFAFVLSFVMIGIY
jgi:hypothetical protein